MRPAWTPLAREGARATSQEKHPRGVPGSHSGGRKRYGGKHINTSTEPSDAGRVRLFISSC